MKLDELQQRMGYVFLEEPLLMQALTHSSFANENGSADNERLEFVGDAVLQLAASEMLAKRFPKAREGQLSRLRSRLVNTTALARIARSLHLGPLLRLGVGEEESGGRDRESVLADATEALLGAIFVEGGFDAAAEVARIWIRERLEVFDDRAVDLQWKDAKSRLQEVVQKSHRVTPVYTTVSQDGPAHQPVFVVEVSIELAGARRVLGRAEGGSFKKASKAAAAEALQGLDP